MRCDTEEKGRHKDIVHKRQQQMQQHTRSVSEQIKKRWQEGGKGDQEIQKVSYANESED